jgi:1-deoxy-D-xylulose-5-phosphate synthase
MAKDGLLDRGVKIRTLTLPDIFQDHDKPELQYAEAGLDADAIANAALRALGRGVNERIFILLSAVG